MVALIDLTGQRFGKLTVVRRAENTKTGQAQWLCRCDCGNEIVVRRGNLQSGNTETCGCSKNKPAPNFIDLSGKKFGRLIVIKKAGKTKSGNITWFCKCDCGKESVVIGSELINGRTQSCGCYNREKKAMRQAEALTTHGGSRTRLYRVWRGMKDRCKNLNNPRYHHYGGRGIKVCGKWLNDFSAFRDWALTNGYSDELTIDRIDVNGDYAPNNCRWISNFEQQSNKKNNRFIEFNGKKLTVAEWERILSFPKGVLSKRLCAGWGIEKALTNPLKIIRRNKNNG